jgi:hypothetical protein
MTGYVLLSIASAALVGASIFLAYRAAQIWQDARAQRFSTGYRLGLALVGAIVPAHYWWEARIDAMSAQEQRKLLAQETAKLGLSRADSQQCPLCGAEIPHAWTLAADGHADVAAGPVECPECDFRLDSCRHCDRFLPGSPPGWLGLGFGEGDITYGRCSFYKAVQPVEHAAPPDMARQLKSRGYERISAPMPIRDSMTRPDSCRAFKASPRRIQASDVDWPDARRTALLHLMDLTSGQDAGQEGPFRGDKG